MRMIWQLWILGTYRFCNRKLHQKHSKEGIVLQQVQMKQWSYIYIYLKENGKECQFSIEDLMNAIKCDVLPDIRAMKLNISKKYGEEVLIAEAANKEAVTCFRNVGNKILSNNWYDYRMSDPQEERLCIVHLLIYYKI